MEVFTELKEKFWSKTYQGQDVLYLLSGLQQAASTDSWAEFKHIITTCSLWFLIQDIQPWWDALGNHSCREDRTSVLHSRPYTLNSRFQGFKRDLQITTRLARLPWAEWNLQKRWAIYYIAFPTDTYHILQGCSTKYFKDGIGFRGWDAQNDGLLPHSGGVLIQRGSELPETEI